MVASYAQDLLSLMVWAFSTVGGALIAVIVWGGLKILSRLDSIEILLAKETKELRSVDSHLETRIKVLEERCHMVHGSSGYAPLMRHTGGGPWDGEERRNVERNWSPGENR